MVTKRQARRNGFLALFLLGALVLVGLSWLLGGDGGQPGGGDVTADTTRGLSGGGDGEGAAGEERGTGDSRDGDDGIEGTPGFEGLADPALSGEPWVTASVEGLLTFRGNPTRSYTGRGPVPRDPVIAHSFPDSAMCGESTNLGETKTWCGMGWTGQPAVFERGGRTWAVFGGYDGAVHFMDVDTGERILPDFPTGDLIKGSPTVDPDGYPLVYIGSRDNYLRVLSIEGSEAVELWRLSADAVSPTKWNDDWDGAPMVIDDYLFEGGENSQFHVVKLNRGEDERGEVTVDPRLVFNTPSWDEELLAALPDETVSVESSPTVVGDVVYFVNSGGLVQGWDMSGLDSGETPTRVFRYWVGDDADATIVADEEGMLYVSVEYERALERAAQVGQLVKLDPGAEGDPLVWKVDDRGAVPGGIWATPAVTDELVYSATNSGEVFAADRATGEKRWSKSLPGPVWGSPVVVDGVLLIGDCAGVLHAYDVSDPGVDPPEIWSVELGGCIEATPAVWDGRVLIGSRGGFLHVIEDASAAS